MRHSPQSPAGSVSSCTPSPVPLHTQLILPATPNSATRHRHGDPADAVDDDMFGSVARRKRREVRPRTKTSEKAEGRQKKASLWARTLSLERVRRKISTVRTWADTARKRLISLRPPPPDPPTSASSSACDSPDLSSEVLVQQARVQCANYIYHRLCSKGLMNRRVHVVPEGGLLAEELCCAAQELERLYPRVYSDVSRRIAMTMSSAQLVRRALTAVLDGTFKTGVTWGKMVSMVVIAAAFAEECVVQGHPDFVEDVVLCVGHFTSLHLAAWLALQGGWSAFPSSRPAVFVEASKRSPVQLYIAAFLFLSLFLAMCFLKFFLFAT